MTYVYNCEIVKVIDGDTIDVLVDLGFDVVMKERVRLFGVNTPEVYGVNANESGRRAADFVRRWFAEREILNDFTLVSKVYNPRDKYGRCLAIIKCGDESLNQALLDSGNASVYK